MNPDSLEMDRCGQCALLYIHHGFDPYGVVIFAALVCLAGGCKRAVGIFVLLLIYKVFFENAKPDAFQGSRKQ